MHPNSASPLNSILARRHGGLFLFAIASLGLAFVTRVALMVKASSEISWDFSLLGSFAIGAIFDFGATALAALPLILLLTCLPASWGKSAWQRWLTCGAGFLILCILVFGAVSEWTFWDEFSARFNFIAVDYLVYTTEVLGNIRESYNLPLILVGVVAGAALVFALLWKTGWPAQWLNAPAEKADTRWRTGALCFAATLAMGWLLNANQIPAFANNYNRELGKNGLWSLFAAFRNNELAYEEFYVTQPTDQVFARLREELTEDGSLLLRPNENDTIRYVENLGAEQHLNVIQITVESLSAEFLGCFNPESKLTPNLDALAAQSLVFENFYATGTRTDRGMEALSLSIPPTPGRSMIKRPENADLFTLGSVFKTKGYDTAFIYGGFGYFDNMNAFFGGNGYRVIDRNSASKDDITFANVWGVSDEDLFGWTLREADQQHAAAKPFHFFVMTTSNHRPYTFPNGRIDLPSKTSGRAGAVKYTDFAIGEFIRNAATKPWFKNTVFVIVADHCASSAGRTELPVQKYHIPLIIYAPGGQIAPGKIKTLTSQIDYAPTLLGLLNWSYPSRFFGHDIGRVPASEGHALLGTYQKLGHLENNAFVVLSPQHGENNYDFNPADSAVKKAPHNIYAENETIAFYEAASHVFKNGKYGRLTPEEHAQFTREGLALALAQKATRTP